jgi:hypothetical protein
LTNWLSLYKSKFYPLPPFVFIGANRRPLRSGPQVHVKRFLHRLKEHLKIVAFKQVIRKFFVYSNGSCWRLKASPICLFDTLFSCQCLFNLLKCGKLFQIVPSNKNLLFWTSWSVSESTKNMRFFAAPTLHNADYFFFTV